MQIHVQICGAVNSQAEFQYTHLFTATAARKSVREQTAIDSYLY